MPNPKPEDRKPEIGAGQVFVGWLGVPDLPDARRAMVEWIDAAGTLPPKTHESVARTPRHEFAPIALWRYGYADTDLASIDSFLARPLACARIAGALEQAKCDSVVVAGSGNGYISALLAGVAGKVRLYGWNVAELWKTLELSRALSLTNLDVRRARPSTDWAEALKAADAIVVEGSFTGLVPPTFPGKRIDATIIFAMGHPFADQALVCRKGQPASDIELCRCYFPPLPSWMSHGLGISPQGAEAWPGIGDRSLEGMLAVQWGGVPAQLLGSLEG